MSSAPSTCEPSSEDKCCMGQAHCIYAGLAIVNVGYMIMRYSNVSLIGMIINMVFYKSLLYMIVSNVCKGKCCESPCIDTHMKKFDRVEECLHQKVNHYLNKLRKLTTLQDMGSFTRTIVAIFFLTTFFGSCSTTFVIVFCIDVFLIMQIGGIKESIKKATDVVVGITGRIIYDNVPRYKDPVENQSTSTSQ